MIKYLPNDMLNEVLAASRSINDELERSDILNVISKHVPDEMLNEVLATAREIHDEDARASVLGAVAQRQPELWEKALTAASKIHNVWERVDGITPPGRIVDPDYAENKI